MFEIVKGDITNIDADIVVNAANKSLLGGGGVDGAIHRKAGSELLKECRSLNGCETGEAKITNGYKMPCKKIIHTVGPVYRDGLHGEDKLLRNCYLNSMKLADEYRIVNNLDTISIAFPCISTGIYHFPSFEAAKIAIDTIKSINNKNIKVIFVCYLDKDYDIYVKYLNS